LEPVVELHEADEIARKILTKQNVSENEFRYVVMFNLAAMTQLLWEFSNALGSSSKNRPRTSQAGSYSPTRAGDIRNRIMKLAPVAALVAFLAGLGLGYLIP
jgi:hypothetical protein